MKKIILLLCFFTMSIFAYSDMIDELDIQKILQQGYKIELSSRDTVVVSKKNAIVSQIVFTKFRDEVDRMIFEGKVKKETLKNDDVNLLIENIVERSEERRVGKECRSRWSPY